MIKTNKTILSSLLALQLVSLSVNAQSLPSSMTKKVEKETQSTPASHLAFDIDVLTSRYSSWGVDPANTKSSINLLNAWKSFKKKKDIIVAVIDTGIDATHPFLFKNIHTFEGKPSPVNYGVDFSQGKVKKSEPIDDHGHGTHVSGIIKSIYPDVKLVALKYYNPKASGQENLNSTIQALKYAVDHNVDVINYSGGGPEPALEELRILKEAESKGILIVAAAGNEESNIDVKQNAYYPASYGLKNIITVTAHDQDLKLLPSSNYGASSVDITAPGYRIRSSLPNSRSGYLTGTSQATAFVTGVAAMLMSEYPELSITEIKDAIKNSARSELTLSNKCSSGGRLDATRAQEVALSILQSKGLKRSLANTTKVSKKSKKKIGQIVYRRKAK
ncbi:MAG: serine protease [Bdellovibrio sp. CG11_big_fil_rev_8_21_14_0_20_39_38]|nr:MAG: serine protease [Bdellovibrio sp. CG22_combo_CG10-13_8_21_14_all_39_27]PIR35416.1 MAG: serine protease [Bdellovibrio sp. CG11_big_fil_rev_8_21_14_0_20_39_38]PJB53284.1 MAG: serine protease [Bdellovibrio sp. CG_4_9_14_3_um_filter_39_7]